MADPRITYNSVNIDLKMGRTGLKQKPIQKAYRNESGSGKTEYINLFGRWEYEFDSYFARSVYYNLIAWWSWVRQGKAWSFALDSSKTGNTTLDDSAAAGQKVIPLTATAAFTADDYCFIKAVDDDDEFEIVEIDSVSAGVSVTVKENLVYSYTATDVFRHKDYFPTVITNSEMFLPEHTGAYKTTGKYYRYIFKFIESL